MQRVPLNMHQIANLYEKGGGIGKGLDLHKSLEVMISFFRQLRPCQWHLMFDETNHKRFAWHKTYRSYFGDCMNLDSSAFKWYKSYMQTLENGEYYIYNRARQLKEVKATSQTRGIWFTQFGLRNITAALLIKLFDAAPPELTADALHDYVYQLARPVLDANWNLWCQRLSLKRNLQYLYPNALLGDSAMDDEQTVLALYDDRQRYQLHRGSNFAPGRTLPYFTRPRTAQLLGRSSGISSTRRKQLYNKPINDKPAEVRCASSAVSRTLKYIVQQGFESNLQGSTGQRTSDVQYDTGTATRKRIKIQMTERPRYYIARDSKETDAHRHICMPFEGKLLERKDSTGVIAPDDIKQCVQVTPVSSGSTAKSHSFRCRLLRQILTKEASIMFSKLVNVLEGNSTRATEIINQARSAGLKSTIESSEQSFVRAIVGIHDYISKF